MKFVERYIRRPHLVLSIVLLLSVIGVMGYQKMPFNLFPDVDRPQISVVTVMPGAAAADVESDITRLIEKEVSTIDMVRKVTSTSKDEASVVTAEFEYEKGLDAAATDVAAQSGSDLIVMGNRGMKAIGSLLLGSVTRAVAIKSPQSVLVVKPPQEKPDGPLKVLFATDGSECARETESVLSMIPFHPDTSVTAVYVSLSTYMDIPDRFCPGLDERLKKIMAGMKEAETKHAEKVLEQARTRLMDRFQKVTVLIKNGDPSEQILQAAQEKQAEVVALGSRGMRGVSGMLGSVARNVLVHADCSVLICKRKEETA